MIRDLWSYPNFMKQKQKLKLVKWYDHVIVFLHMPTITYKDRCYKGRSNPELYTQYMIMMHNWLRDNNGTTKRQNAQLSVSKKLDEEFHNHQYILCCKWSVMKFKIRKKSSKKDRQNNGQRKNAQKTNPRDTEIVICIFRE
jgi:hypothetical protein